MVQWRFPETEIKIEAKDFWSLNHYQQMHSKQRIFNLPNRFQLQGWKYIRWSNILLFQRDSSVILTIYYLKSKRLLLHFYKAKGTNTIATVVANINRTIVGLNGNNYNGLMTCEMYMSFIYTMLVQVRFKHKMTPVFSVFYGNIFVLNLYFLQLDIDANSMNDSSLLSSWCILTTLFVLL